MALFLGITIVYISILFWFMVGHAVADYALQNEFVAKYKGRGTPEGASMFPHVLLNHALIHGGAVGLVAMLLTKSSLGIWLGLALAETVCHFTIDFFKTEKRIGFHADQFLHWGCKALWTVVILYAAFRTTSS